MKRHLAALAALVILALPVATGCAKTAKHHHTDAVPVCSHVQHSLAGDYVRGGHRPCLLQTPTAHHHHASPRPTRTSIGTSGIHPATTGRPATASVPRFSKAPAPAPKLSKAAPPAPAKKAAPPAPAKKAPSFTKSRPSR